MPTDSQIGKWIREAFTLGQQAAYTAATWIVNGNSDSEERARVLQMLRDGDGAAFDYLPRRPDLSGEYAEDLTPRALAEDIMGSADLNSEIVDALATAFEDGVLETFGLACEAELIAFDGRV